MPPAEGTYRLVGALGELYCSTCSFHQANTPSLHFVHQIPSSLTIPTSRTNSNFLRPHFPLPYRRLTFQPRIPQTPHPPHPASPPASLYVSRHTRPPQTLTTRSSSALAHRQPIKLELKDWPTSGHTSPDVAEHDRRPDRHAMRSAPRLRDFNPLRWLNFTHVAYQRIPDYNTVTWRRRPSRFVVLVVAGLVVLALIAGGGGGYHHARRKGKLIPVEPKMFPWQEYEVLRGYWNGVRTLVRWGEWEGENGYNVSAPRGRKMLELDGDEDGKGRKKEKLDLGLDPMPPLQPVVVDPYPDYEAEEYLRRHQPVHRCYLDKMEKVPARNVYAYPGVPQHMSEPLIGSYQELGLQDQMCFDRFGRLSSYGFGFNENGTIDSNRTEMEGSEKVFGQADYINFTNVDWGEAQQICHQKNAARFQEKHESGKERVQRHAYVLRTWTGYKYSEHQKMTMRAMINELALKSGGEYDVHLLLHVKDNSIPIWADKGLYRETLESNVPREFWNITTLWSEQQMKLYYPEPFPNNFANMVGSNIHGVYRSAHFPLQWFSQQHPEYDFFWNWEMDIRYSGHYYDFNTKIGQWAKDQPRKGLWERGSRFYIPKYHGSWQNFTHLVERETAGRDASKDDIKRSGPRPVWGPVQDFPNTGMLPFRNETLPPTTYDQDNYTWGVGEDADLITFNPIFDPSMTNWVFSRDVTGYSRNLPIPPRRAAIITVARLSKRLLDTMHEETWRMKHTMFPEMFPAAIAFHHGLKAVYVPHPVYMDHDWDVGALNQVLNEPRVEWESPFGWGEHNLLGSSFYYNSGFSGLLWRRWLGIREKGEGGKGEEERGTGRMCLRGLLLHPVKHEQGPVD